MADANKLNRILSQLQRVKQTGSNQWLACCPAHDDKNPSLSIAIGDNGRILFHCFAGCEFEDIVSALNGTSANDTGSINDTKQIIETYDYKDQEGRLLFQKVRYTERFSLQAPRQ